MMMMPTKNCFLVQLRSSRPQFWFSKVSGTLLWSFLRWKAQTVQTRLQQIAKVIDLVQEVLVFFILLQFFCIADHTLPILYWSAGNIQWNVIYPISLQLLYNSVGTRTDHGFVSQQTIPIFLYISIEQLELWL